MLVKRTNRKSYKPAKGSCLQVAMDVPQSGEPSQTSYWLGIRFAFFVWLMWKTVYLGKSVAPRLSCNANSNPFLAASLTPNQSHKPGNFKMIYWSTYHSVLQTWYHKVEIYRRPLYKTDNFLEHISPFQFQFLQVVKLWAKLKEEERILQTLLFRWLWRPWKELKHELQAWHTFDFSLRIQKLFKLFN